MLIDSHCHLDFAEFKSDLTEVLRKAKDERVVLMQTICTKISEFQSILRVANADNSVYCSLGVHPHEVEKEGLFSAEKIAALCAHPKVIGIGETGLDFYYKNSNVEIQKLSFIEHIKAAQLTGLPVIVHTRDAEIDTVAILKEYMSIKPFKGVIHCFTSSENMARQCLELGLYISFSGIITFKNAIDLRSIAEKLPLERLLIETDSPYLAPVPYRGKRNEPALVKKVAEIVSEIKQISFEEVSKVTTDNFLQLFDKAKL